MIPRIRESSIFAAVLATGLILAGQMEFAKAQNETNAEQIQAVIDILKTEHPMLAELEADESAADLDSESNQVIDKLASMNTTEAMHLRLTLEALEVLKDLKAIHMIIDNQTAS